MFDKVSKYLSSELTDSEAEYALLQEMNTVTAAKYQDLRQIATNISKGIVTLNDKCRYLTLCLYPIQ